MKLFRAIFKFEWKRAVEKKYRIIIGIVLLLSLGLTALWIKNYEESLYRKEVFQQIEQLKVSKYISYRQYGTYGFRTIFVGAPISILFADSCTVPDIDAFVDAGDRLKIYLPVKGQNIFKLRKIIFADFSGIIYFFGSLIALLYGFHSFRNTQYLRIISSLAKFRYVVLCIAISRLIILATVLTALIASVLALVSIAGHPISIDSHLLGFVLGAFLYIASFFALGSAFGTTKSVITGISGMLSIWIILLFVIPAAIDIVIAMDANNIKSIYLLEIDKRKILLDFEKKAIEKALSYKIGEASKEEVIKYVESFYNTEFKKIQLQDDEMLRQIKKEVKLYQNICSFFPSTFYISSNTELSSRGYKNYIKFQEFVQKSQYEFSHFYRKKVYNRKDIKRKSPVIAEKVESFVKGEDNIYFASSCFITTSIRGWSFNIIYFFILIFISYSRLKKRLYFSSSTVPLKSLLKDININWGRFNEWSIEGDFFRNYLYGWLSGQKKSKKKIHEMELPSINFNKKTSLFECNGTNFFFLCHPCLLPGTFNAGDFLDMISTIVGENKRDFDTEGYEEKNLQSLDQEETGKFIIDLLSLVKAEVYFLEDVCKGLYTDFVIDLKKKMDGLLNKGVSIIFVYSETGFRLGTRDKVDIYFKTTNWSRMVDSLISNNDLKPSKY